MIKKCGYIAIIGRANVGKSTIFNKLIGSKLSITSYKPHTTRYLITGIKTDDTTQFIYIDNPGYDSSLVKNNIIIMKKTFNIIHDVDVILFVIESNRWTYIEELLLNKIIMLNMSVSIILVINKVDSNSYDSTIINFKEELHNKKRLKFTDIVLISAKHGHQLMKLEDIIRRNLPMCDKFIYPNNMITNSSKEFIISEIIREKLIRMLGQEIPYQLSVTINSIININNIINIIATILVERRGQKIIIIGKKGEKIKNISIQARKDIEIFVSQQVFLKLWIKVREQ